MLEHLKALDEALFLWLNGLHHPLLDPVMFHISGKWQWTPLYLGFAWLMYLLYGKRIWIPLLGVGLVILLSDQACSGLLKPLTERLRPSHEPALEGLVHLVNGKHGGRYGFASSHAANTFGLAMFLWMLFRDKWPWFRWVFLWAALVSYSRIYLGVHYPGDVAVGAFIGLMMGYGVWRLGQRGWKRADS
jgi:undecaprenyl-diphosphatase